MWDDGTRDHKGCKLFKLNGNKVCQVLEQCWGGMHCGQHILNTNGWVHWLPTTPFHFMWVEEILSTPCHQLTLKEHCSLFIHVIQDIITWRRTRMWRGAWTWRRIHLLKKKKRKELKKKQTLIRTTRRNHKCEREDLGTNQTLMRNEKTNVKWEKNALGKHPILNTRAREQTSQNFERYKSKRQNHLGQPERFLSSLVFAFSP